jgi:hypothetical protein
MSPELNNQTKAAQAIQDIISAHHLGHQKLSSEIGKNLHCLIWNTGTAYFQKGISLNKYLIQKGTTAVH